MSTKHEPVLQTEADQAFACLAGFHRLVLAVSGGPDSLALLYLVAEWNVRRGNAAQVFVATVDHGLRVESAQEANFVAVQCVGLGVPHTILQWEHGRKLSSGLADAARRARYQLLESYATSLQPDLSTAVVTAHTEDDQAETFLMRLARGSGVDGLAAMPVLRPLSPGSRIKLARPLLGFSKSRLIASLEARGQTWCTDPSNANEAYERVRLRTALAALNSVGVEAPSISRSARRLDGARAALGYASKEFEAKLRLSLNNDIFTSFDRREFSHGPRLLRERLLASLIARHGGTTPAPELLEVESLVAELDARDQAMMTLGGAVISAGPRTVRVWREAGRIGHGDLELSPGVPSLWDNRFWVETTGARDLPVSVRALGEAGYQLLSATADAFNGVPGNLPGRAAHALPAFWSGRDLLAVPQLGLRGRLAGEQAEFASIAKTAPASVC